MSETTNIDWDKFSVKRLNPEAVKKLSGLVTKFFQKALPKNRAPKAMETLEGRKFFPSDSNLYGAVPVISVYGKETEFDFGYERIFDFVDMTKSKSKTFDILDVTNGVSFEQVIEGEKAKLRNITSGKVAVGYLKFMAGLGILDDWWRFNEYYKMEALLNAVRSNYYGVMATNHYALIPALTGIDQAFATDDSTTINNACAAIITSMASKGYSIPENPVFTIVAGTGLKARIAKALRASFSSPNANVNEIVYNIGEVVATPKVTNTQYWVCLPGLKNQRAVWDHLNAESQRDALRRAEDMTWEGKYNGAIGDKTQFRKCLLS